MRARRATYSAAAVLAASVVGVMGCGVAAAHDAESVSAKPVVTPLMDDEDPAGGNFGVENSPFDVAWNAVTSPFADPPAAPPVD
ncbi:hypothetical protein OG288_37415 [Streptomyces tauricus]|uniref:Lipoprotein n=1 Tax=Streptomyces tauricus TaxID=68274 RepID=A0ABZ1JPE9_9ACTN|nr:hypothetical protein [Streptomyces tauricus]